MLVTSKYYMSLLCQMLSGKLKTKFNLELKVEMEKPSTISVGRIMFLLLPCRLSFVWRSGDLFMTATRRC